MLEQEPLLVTACCHFCFQWIVAGDVPEVWALYADGSPWCKLCDRCAEGGPDNIRRRLVSLREQYLALAAGLAEVEHVEIEIKDIPAAEPLVEYAQDATVAQTRH